MSLTNLRNFVSQLATRVRTKYKAVTASETLTRQESGSVITNIGATGTVTVTLPQDAESGCTFTFLRAATYAFRIDPGAAGGIYAFSAYTWAKQTDNKYIEITIDGGSITLVADGNGDWVSTSVTDSLGFAVES